MSGRREAERDFLYQKYLFAMVLIFVSAIVVLIFDEDGIPYAIFLIDGQTILGTITEFENKEHTYVLYFNYIDQSETLHSKINLFYSGSAVANESVLPLFTKVNAIEVTYSSTFPTIFEATLFIPTRENDFWLMLGGITFIIFRAYLSVLLIYQIVKHRQQDRYY